MMNYSSLTAFLKRRLWRDRLTAPPAVTSQSGGTCSPRSSEPAANQDRPLSASPPLSVKETFMSTTNKNLFRVFVKWETG